MKNIAILGFGTVGSGVYEVVKNNGDVLEKRIGEKISVKRVLDKRHFPGNEVENILTENFDDILNDLEIDVVVEVIGGVEPALTFSKQAMLKGKSVVTSNKELVAKCGPELLKIAKENNVSYLFEASVGGAIPIIRPLMVCLTADKIDSIYGILNGTTNYILTKMANEGKAFDEVLKTAQQLGYAEANPSADVDGHDACRKIAILSSIAFGGTVNYEDVYTEGITKITSEDIAYAEKLNSVIKLVGSSRKTDFGVSAKVCPCMLSKEHPLAGVNDAYNAIFVNGNMSGNTMYYGSGAGKLPTASAVVADVVDAVINEGKTVNVFWNYENEVAVEKIGNLPVKAFVRVGCADVAKAEKSVGNIFGVSEFIFLETHDDEFAFVVLNDAEDELLARLEELKLMEGVKEIRSLIRMEG